MRTLGLTLFAALTLAACGPKQQKPASTAAATPATPGTSNDGALIASANPARMDPATLPDVVKLKGAAGKSGARYANPLAAFDEPQDAKNMSDYSEYGWREAITDQNSDSFKEFGPTPAGWWVYVKPYWVVYNLKDGKTGP